jgi:hypothetical protein
MEIGETRLLLSCRRNLAETQREEGDIIGAPELNQEILEESALHEDYEMGEKQPTTSDCV